MKYRPTSDTGIILFMIIWGLGALLTLAFWGLVGWGIVEAILWLRAQ